jgi:DnaJ-class molecular chaperone
MANDQYKQFNCYLVLQISPDATPGEIKAAMRKASLRSHPDLGGSHAEQAKINVAYEVLSDPVQRQSHDIYWKAREQRTSSSQQTRRDQAKPSGNRTSTGSPSSSTQSFAGFQRRVDAAIQAKKANIWGDLEAVKRRKVDELFKKVAGEKNTFYTMAAVGSFLGLLALQYPLLWPVVGLLAFGSFTKKLRG